MTEELKSLLEELDKSSEKQSEFGIHRRIVKIIKDNDSDSLEVTAERMAFAFRENYEKKDTDWGTYYYPIAWTDDGELYEDPRLSLITEAVLNYWAVRAVATQNQLMKARYSGLIWDLSNKILQKKPDYQMAKLHVESLVAVCDSGLCDHPIESIRKITRAYKVAKSLNNEDLIKTCIRSAIRLEESIRADDKQGLWGGCFELFILEGENCLTDEQEKKLIADQENLLDLTSKGSAVWLCESVGIPLATYYRKIDRNEDVRRVIGVVGEHYETACVGAEALRASSLLQHVHAIYIRFDLGDKAESVSKKISEVGPSVIESMQSFSHRMKIPKEKLDAYLDAMTDGGKELALNRIAIEFIPQKDQIKKEVLEIARDHPLIYLFTTNPIDHKGRTVATIGGIEDDLEGNTVYHLSQNLQINAFFLHRSIHKAIERYKISCDDLLDFVFQSPIFEDVKKDIIKKGISAFLKKDYCSSVHLLIPQIEDAVRNLAGLMDARKLRKKRSSVLQLRTLDDLLREKRVENCLGTDRMFYFRTLLTDQRGWNMRNDVCHGISPSSMFNYSTADRVLHVLLCLQQVRKNHD